ncbi:hypothetical protein CIW49_26145 [Mycolicibacterium sp. P1-18]|nr:hypothetical protein CIW49_26145 [Mycolicibacterium sp. P1-18]
MNVLAAGAVRSVPMIPAWSATLFVLAALWWLGFFIAAIRTKELRVERRLYWLGYGGVAVLAGLGLCFRGWQTGAGGAGFVVAYTVLYAALKTPYLKIGNRLITASDSDRRRDERDCGIAPRRPARENYATSSPAKMWWLLVFFSAMSAASVLLPHDGDWRSWIVPVMYLVYAPFIGVLDGRGRFPVARRQWVPAALVGVASVALYGIPVVLYAAGYIVGRRLPVSYGWYYDKAVHQDEEGGDGVATEPSRDVSRSR